MIHITTDGMICEKTENHPARFRQFGGSEVGFTGELHEITLDIVFQHCTNPPLGLVQVNGESLLAFST